MHSIARENLQTYLYSYKDGKEQGISLLSDGRARYTRRVQEEEKQAVEALRNVIVSSNTHSWDYATTGCPRVKTSGAQPIVIV